MSVMRIVRLAGHLCSARADELFQGETALPAQGARPTATANIMHHAYVLSCTHATNSPRPQAVSIQIPQDGAIANGRQRPQFGSCMAAASAAAKWRWRSRSRNQIRGRQRPQRRKCRTRRSHSDKAVAGAGIGCCMASAPRSKKFVGRKTLANAVVGS